MMRFLRIRLMLKKKIRQMENAIKFGKQDFDLSLMVFNMVPSIATVTNKKNSTRESYYYINKKIR